MTQTELEQFIELTILASRFAPTATSQRQAEWRQTIVENGGAAQLSQAIERVLQ
jgi:hypothetical protein